MISLGYVMMAYVLLLCCAGLFMLKKLSKVIAKNTTNHQMAKFLDNPLYQMIGVGVLSVLILCFAFQRVYGIFGEPSILTLALASGYIIDFAFNKPVQVNKRAVNWFGLMAFFIVLTSIGAFNAIGIDFYHRYFDKTSLIIHYALFALIFGVAMMLDKKSVYLAWVVLLAFILSVMSSQNILDYVADFWLFMLGLGVLGKGVLCGIKKFWQMTIKNKKAIS